MNRQLSAAELAALPIAMPVLTKRDKLFRLAQLIRSCGYPLQMFSGIEYATPDQLRMMTGPGTPFALAASDPMLRDAGLTTNNVADATRFFELTRDELHAFSCDCGGRLSNDQMARRVEALAVSAR